MKKFWQSATWRTIRIGAMLTGIVVLAAVALVGLLSVPNDELSTGKWVAALIVSKAIGVLALAGVWGIIACTKELKNKINELCKE